MTSPVLGVVPKDLLPAATVIGDQGYDRDKIRKMLAQQGITPCIGHHALHSAPSLPQEASPLQQEAGSQGSQNRDTLFLTAGWRRVATRYGGCLAAIILFW